jgi:hypothetical protein
MSWATFWAIISETHLVTLAEGLTIELKKTRNRFNFFKAVDSK